MADGNRIRTFLSSQVKPSHPPGHVNLTEIGPTFIGQNVPFKASNQGIDGEVGIEAGGLLWRMLPVAPKVVGGVRRVEDVCDAVDDLDDVNLALGRPTGAIPLAKHPYSSNILQEMPKWRIFQLTDSWP